MSKQVMSMGQEMERPKHTPGPWQWNEDEYGIRDRNGDPFIEEIACDCSTDEADANRRLIAAAPEMLEALRNYDKAFADFNPDDKTSRHQMRLAVIKARDAIDKATGGD